MPPAIWICKLFKFDAAIAIYLRLVVRLCYARMLGARHIQITYLAMLCEVVFTTQRGAMMRCWAVCPPTLGLYADSDYPQS